MEWNYRYRLQVGMTLEQATSVLGPAKKHEQPMQIAVGKEELHDVVQGDEFYSWGEWWKGPEIWVGVRDGKICDKYLNFIGN